MIVSGDMKIETINNSSVRSVSEVNNAGLVVFCQVISNVIVAYFHKIYITEKVWWLSSTLLLFFLKDALWMYMSRQVSIAGVLQETCYILT